MPRRLPSFPRTVSAVLFGSGWMPYGGNEAYGLSITHEATSNGVRRVVYNDGVRLQKVSTVVTVEDGQVTMTGHGIEGRYQGNGCRLIADGRHSFLVIGRRRESAILDEIDEGWLEAIFQCFVPLATLPAGATAVLYSAETVEREKHTKIVRVHHEVRPEQSRSLKSWRRFTISRGVIRAAPDWDLESTRLLNEYEGKSCRVFETRNETLVIVGEPTFLDAFEREWRGNKRPLFNYYRSLSERQPTPAALRAAQER